VNITHAFFDRCQQFPAQPAIIFEGRTWTYADVRDHACRAAGGLDALGVKQGDRVALLIPNIPEFVYVYFAVQILGAVAVSLNVMLKQNELRYVLNDCQPGVILTVAELAPHIPADLAYPCQVVLVDDSAADLTLPGWMAQTQGLAAIAPTLPDDPAAIVYTSGTTGFPKGAVLSQHNLHFNAQAKHHYCGMQPSDRLLLFVPLFHCFGQNAVMISGLHAGATLVLHRRFDLEQVIDSISRHQATMFFGVPTIYVNMLNAGVAPSKLGSIRYYFSAASILQEATARAWARQYGIVINEGYGLTETSPFSSYNHDEDYRFGSIGTPINGVEMKIVDEGLNELPPGNKGEIVIKGPNVMLGYWNELNQPSSVIKDGWFHSGDIGTMDSQGYFYIVDRIKDMVNVSGFKVYPSDVERMIHTHPAVKDVAVYGVSDPIKNEVVCADIVLHDSAAASLDDITTFCSENMANYKIPAVMTIVSSIPRNPAGKVLKHVLREEARRRREQSR
jgi:long-chain acyl-CoA synthetase